MRRFIDLAMIGASAGALSASFLLPIANAAVAARMPQVRLDHLEVHHDVTDELLSEEASDSLFRYLLGRPKLIGTRQTRELRGISGGCFEFPNPFSTVDTPRDTIPIRVDLCLEQCTYSRPIDVEKSIETFWFFGIIGTSLEPKNIVAGEVEWRVRWRRIGSPDVHVVVGRGVCGGSIERLDRRTAVMSANRRALWELVNDLVFDIARTCKFELKQRGISTGLGEYARMMDGAED